MAYVIAEPCIGTKDTACVDACPVDSVVHPKKDEDAPPTSCSSTRSSASTAAPASRPARSRRSSRKTICPENWASFAEKNAKHFGR